MRVYLFLLSILVAQIGAAAFSAPAAAKPASIGAVESACNRTKDCHYHSCGNGCATGCSPVVCFNCSSGKCSGISSGTGRMGSRTLIGSGNLKRLLNGVKTTGSPASPRHGMRPVNVSGFRTKTIYRGPGPTDSGGKGSTGHRNSGSTFQNFNDHGHHGR